MRAIARLRVMLLLCGTGMLVALACPVALGSKGVVSMFGASGSGDGQFANAYGTAANLSTGDVYIVDQFGYRVEQFDASGSFVRAFGWGVVDGTSAAQTCTSNCQAGVPGNGDGQFDTPQGIAIDQSDGSVYVVDGNNNRVEKFSSAGVYQSQFGGAGNGDGQFTGPQGIAVAAGGAVYVADSGDHRVEKFDSVGIYQSQFGTEGSGDGQFEGPTRVAVDSTGQIYVLDAGNGRIERFTSAGAFDQVFDPTDVSAPQEIAVGPGNDHLYVAQWAQDFSEQHVLEIDTTGALADTHGRGSGANNSSGLALNSASQKIYLADGFNARVFVLDDVTAPDVTIDPPAAVTSTGASLSGTVNPNGNPSVGWRFEISTDDANWTPVAGDQDPGSGNSLVPVTQNLSGLVPNTTDFVRLVARRAFNAPTISSEVQFTTVAVAPDVVTEQAQDVGTDHATFQATLHPHNSPTTYHFEYGTSTAYGQRIPAVDADGGSGNVVTAVFQRINILNTGTTYHYRIVATNTAGTVHGQDQSFSTTVAPPASTHRPGIPGTGFLPDNRGWELVSPGGKQGNDLTVDTGRTRAATDGDAVQFTSHGAFSGTQGAGATVDYMSLRDARDGTSGWSTHSLTPPQGAVPTQLLTLDFDPHYEGEFASDLSQGVFRTSSPLTDVPNVANVGNLYMRDDLLTSGAGFYRLVSECPFCSSPLGPVGNGGFISKLPRLANASPDFSHVLFESAQRLTSDATANGSGGNLFEWDHGTVRLAGVLPDGSAASKSQAGPGAVNEFYMPRTISNDGSRVFFTDPSGGGSRITGQLYMRVNHTSTVQINASERTDCADHDPCSGTAEPDPGGVTRAEFWTASSDGLRSFFTSPEALTDDAQPGVQHLYMYDANGALEHRLHSLIPGDPNLEGVIGASDDGHYVYFMAANQVVAGQPDPDPLGFFLWHDGSISYIGALTAPGSDAAFDLPNRQWTFDERFAARVTQDGRHLLFVAATGGQLAGYDHGGCGGLGCYELYIYSANSHSLRCASCKPTGQPAEQNAFDNFKGSEASTTWHLNRPLSTDGQRVFFTTGEALVPDDSNGRNDVYAYDVSAGTVRLISSGRDPSDSYFMDASASGNDVFFLTRQQLVGWDHDQNYDLYDARVGGGMPEPVALPPGCSGEGCKGPLSGAPSAATPGSSTSSGSGNVGSHPKSRRVVKPVRCKRGSVRKKVKGKVRCVKPKKRPKRHGKKAVKRTPRRTK